MKSFKVLQSLMTEANRNMVKFIKSGDDKKAVMWAERLEELEKEMQLI